MKLIQYKLTGEKISIFSTTKKLGSMKTGEKINFVNINKALNVGGISSPIILGEQVHGKLIEVVGKDSKRFIKNVDGLVSREKNMSLGVITADCLPVVFYDPVKMVIGIIHAGYKGILLGIVEELVRIFKKMGTKTEDIKVFFGPGICGKCYEIGLDIKEKCLRKYSFAKIIEEEGKVLWDLQSTVSEILKKNKFKKENLSVSSICTFEKPILFSARRSKNKLFGEFLTIVSMHEN